MTPLPKTFHKKGFAFTQIDRQGDVALFRKTKGTVESFEVVIVQKHKARTMGGVDIPACEAMPSSEDWGCKGCSYTTKSDAFRRMGKLLSRN